MRIKWMILLLTILVISCTSQIVTKYQCTDGRFVDNAEQCSKPIKDSLHNETVEYSPSTNTRYQCIDGTFVDDQNDCPVFNNDKLVETEPSKPKEPRRFQGDSDTVTDKFYLEPGLVIFKLKYAGDSNFIVTIIDSYAERGSFVNEVGEYDATKSLTVYESGYYRIEVDIGTSYNDHGFTSKADWSIIVEQ